VAAPAAERVILIVLDSVGVGELPDAPAYGDQGSNTLGNIARATPLRIPALRSLGIDRILDLGDARSDVLPLGAYGRMAERSAGKDSVTGHWELAGLVLDRPFPTFPDGFPPEVIAEFERRIGRGSLANTVASGTVIIDQLGDEHVRTGKPIIYTSADSVFQIAAHEEVVPVDELYRWCEVAYEIVGEGMGVGRVIARPFAGPSGAYRRTANRRDFALTPFAPTLLDLVKDAGLPVVAVGKVEDLFAGRGMTRAVHTVSDDDGMDQVERAMASTGQGLIFANLVDFDTQFGHRNDLAGYAANLEKFDARLARLLPRLRDTDVLMITADHGNDPTTPSTDHSREYVPLMVAGRSVRRGVDLGTRDTYADAGQTVADLLGVPPLANGTSFRPAIIQPVES
jgi:phosphopentomutase